MHDQRFSSRTLSAVPSCASHSWSRMKPSSSRSSRPMNTEPVCGQRGTQASDPRSEHTTVVVRVTHGVVLEQESDADRQHEVLAAGRIVGEGRRHRILGPAAPSSAMHATRSSRRMMPKATLSKIEPTQVPTRPGTSLMRSSYVERGLRRPAAANSRSRARDRDCASPRQPWSR